MSNRNRIVAALVMLALMLLPFSTNAASLVEDSVRVAPSIQGIEREGDIPLP